MHLIVRQLRRERKNLMRNNIKFQTIGDVERLPALAREVVRETVEMTAGNTGMVLVSALSYGGRQEIAQMARELVRQAKAGSLEEDEVDEALVANYLPSSFLPDPDLIIRTSGESRISNFFLWQSAYSEIEFETKAWPDFNVRDLHRTLEAYSARERRFGRTSEQTAKT
jgi:undecaprenyl diphosphate synthase